MKPIVTLIAPGGMGSGLGGRLVENGIEVRTLLDGRSDATLERAKSAGMIGANEAALSDVDIVLSVVPPNQAMPLVQKMAPLLGAMEKPPIYVECNAVNPESAKEMAKVMAAAGVPFVDGGIIGLPPKEGYNGPTLFVAGDRAKEIEVLNEYGLFISTLDGPVGAASALKMSYAGITKGLIAIGSAMVLSAERAGAGEALRTELAKSQSYLFGSFGRSIPNMYSKARRWVPEMHEIAEFSSERSAEKQIYKGFADFYQRMADDFDGESKEVEVLRAFFEKRDGE